MTKQTLKTTIAATAIALSGAAASAATIDFTSAATNASGMLGNGITWSLTAQGGTLTNSQLYDGGATPASGGGLAFERDGYGVDDDEISQGDNESLTLTFSDEVRLTGTSFLDVFTHEFGIVTAGGTQFANANSTGEAGGFTRLDDLNIVSDWFRFFASVPDDHNDIGDVALASVNVTAVPLPAAGLLLLGALGGMGAMRRRQSVRQTA